VSVFLEESQTADRTDYVLAGARSAPTFFPPRVVPYVCAGRRTEGELRQSRLQWPLDYLGPKRLVIWPPVPRVAAKTSYALVPGSPHNE